MMKCQPIILLAILILIGACKKKEDEIDPIPSISYSSISHNEVVQFDNAVSIFFSYYDGDGDIGYQDPDTYSLRVKDARLEDYDWYHIPPLTPDQQLLDIEGTFSVELPPLFLLGNGAQETTTFTLQVQDRAGNWSNQIMTPEVLIADSL